MSSNLFGKSDEVPRAGEVTSKAELYYNKQLVECIQSLITNSGVGAYDLHLNGSRAQNLATEDSDYDIVIGVDTEESVNNLVACLDEYGFSELRNLSKDKATYTEDNHTILCNAEFMLIFDKVMNVNVIIVSGFKLYSLWYSALQLAILSNIPKTYIKDLYSLVIDQAPYVLNTSE